MFGYSDVTITQDENFTDGYEEQVRGEQLWDGYKNRTDSAFVHFEEQKLNYYSYYPQVQKNGSNLSKFCLKTDVFLGQAVQKDG